MVRILTLCFASALFTGLMGASPALAHDSWISAGGFRNIAGEWCCGAGDCAVIRLANVQMSGVGYHMVDGEIVPFRRRSHRPTAPTGAASGPTARGAASSRRRRGREDASSLRLSFVMAGTCPGHPRLDGCKKEDVDARHKAGA